MLNMATTIICIILVVICVLGSRSYVKKLSHGCCGSGGNKVRRQKPSDANESHYPFRYQLEIDGMTCMNCAARIENAFNATGNYYATVNLNKKTALIRAKEETAEEELRRLVAKSGYSVVKFSKDER